MIRHSSPPFVWPVSLATYRHTLDPCAQSFSDERHRLCKPVWLMIQSMAAYQRTPRSEKFPSSSSTVRDAVISIECYPGSMKITEAACGKEIQARTMLQELDVVFGTGREVFFFGTRLTSRELSSSVDAPSPSAFIFVSLSRTGGARHLKHLRIGTPPSNPGYPRRSDRQSSILCRLTVGMRDVLSLTCAK